MTDDGLELPVIDITHQAFAFKISESELNTIAEKYIRELERMKRIPAFVRRFYIAFVAHRSILMRSMMEARGSFLSGISTYLRKLGPDNLGKGYSGWIDRWAARNTIGLISFRIRLNNMARLIADGLTPVLIARQDQPLYLFNIAGGPAADSLNALILIRKEHPGWLEGRQILIYVFDIDKAGPSFGSRALDALLTKGAPLQDLIINFEHIEYDWSDVSKLRKLINQVGAKKAVLCISSEGGLFEYGSDEVIITNLQAMHEGTPDDCVIVGSLSKDNIIVRAGGEWHRIPIHYFSLDAFEALI